MTANLDVLLDLSVEVVRFKDNPDSVYIGRGSVLGNPFRMYREEQRDSVCDKFSIHVDDLIANKDPDILDELQKLVDTVKRTKSLKLGCFCAPKRCHGDKIKEVILSMLKSQSSTPLFKYSRYKGYEVSSKGDSRFSAFYAKLDDGRTIEQHYQCDIKGFDPGGTNWRLGKGKPPKYNLTVDELYAKYLDLWRQWSSNHVKEMDELRENAVRNDYTLRDRFASTPVNQARALAEILSESEFN